MMGSKAWGFEKAVPPTCIHVIPKARDEKRQGKMRKGSQYFHFLKWIKESRKRVFFPSGSNLTWAQKLSRGFLTMLTVRELVTETVSVKSRQVQMLDDLKMHQAGHSQPQRQSEPRYCPLTSRLSTKQLVQTTGKTFIECFTVHTGWLLCYY